MQSSGPGPTYRPPDSGTRSPTRPSTSTSVASASGRPTQPAGLGTTSPFGTARPVSACSVARQAPQSHDTTVSPAALPMAPPPKSQPPSDPPCVQALHGGPPQQREGHFDTPPSRPVAQRAWSRPGCLLARRSERCPLNHAQCESGECCDSGSGEQRLFTCAAVDRYASAASPEGSAASLGSGPCTGQRMQRPSTIPPTVQCGGGAHAPRLGPRGGSLGMASMNSSHMPPREG